MTQYPDGAKECDLQSSISAYLILDAVQSDTLSTGSHSGHCQKGYRRRKTGARGLRAIMEDAMMDLMYTIPSDLSAIECQITEDVIVKGEAPLIIYGDRGPVRKGSAKKLPKKNGGEIA